MSDTTSEFAGEIAAAVEKTAPAEDTTPVQPTQDTAVTPEPTPIASDAVTPDEPGPIPFHAHDRIVKGFHSRLDAMNQSLGWANGLNRQEVEEALAIRRQLSQRQSAARDAEPQPDVKDERGDLFYSPGQAAKWAAWQSQRIVDQRMAEIEERIGPMEGAYQQQQRTTEIVHQHDHVMSLPGAKEHEAAMADYIYQINERRAAGENFRKPTAMDAYLAVVPSQLHKASELTPARLAEEKKKWAAELSGATERVQDEVNPSRAPASKRKKDGEYTFKEAWAEKMSGSR